MGSVSTTATANWTVVKDAAGYPTVVSGDDVTIYMNTTTPFFNGEAWSDIDLMDPIPAGATITDVLFSMTAQVSGSRAISSIPVSPIVDLIDKTEYLSGTFGLGYGTFGAGGPGALPNDNDPHFITYDNNTLTGGGGIFDPDAFAAALSNPSTPVILRVQAQQGATGTGLTYIAPLTITFTYDDGATGVPPLRLTNRDDLRLTGKRSQQGSNRLTGYL